MEVTIHSLDPDIIRQRAENNQRIGIALDVELRESQSFEDTILGFSGYPVIPGDTIPHGEDERPDIVRLVVKQTYSEGEVSINLSNSTELQAVKMTRSQVVYAPSTCWITETDINFIFNFWGQENTIKIPWKSDNEEEQIQWENARKALFDRNQRLGHITPPGLFATEGKSSRSLPTKRGRPKKETTSKFTLPFFKSRQSTATIAAGYSHAEERRGTPDNTDENLKNVMVIAPATNKKITSTNKKGYSHAYQLPLLPGDDNRDLIDKVVECLGIKSWRYLCAIEALLQFSNSTDGTLYCHWGDFLEIMGMADRTENRRQVRKWLFAAANLRVYAEITEKRPYFKQGKTLLREVTEHRFEPFLTVDPVTLKDGKTLNSIDAMVKTIKGDIEDFDGVRIHLTHWAEADKSFVFFPTEALKMGSSKSELVAFGIARFILGEMTKDWKTNGGEWESHIFPQYAQGGEGSISSMKIQGLLQRVGLSTHPHSRSRIIGSEEKPGDLESWLSIAKANDLLSNAYIDGQGVNAKIVATAPEWLWNMKQKDTNKVRFLGETPYYIRQLKKQK